MNAPLAPLDIVYVGPLHAGSTCRQRALALESLGHRLVRVDQTPGDLAARQLRFGWRVRRRLLGDRDECALNARLLALPAAAAPDVLWIDKGLTVEPSTLRVLRARWPDAVFVNYSGDDMFNPRNQTSAWRANLPLYDLFATTKSFNVPELAAAGARATCFIEKGFSPEVHRPHEVTPELLARFGGDVGFIGWPEGEREDTLRFLARRGIDVRVWGPWPRWKSAPHLRVEGRPLWDDDYAAALSAFRINLGFLRRVNRDRHTTRSVEIPACGGFLLAERTDEHRRLFREDEEAVFFSTRDELLDKLRYYLAHEDERSRIAAAGLRRCREGGYSNQDRLTGVLRAALARRAAADAAA
ncbi:MAG TPA: glycosyltransferase [Candidatus Acidoferrales bacterium]|nr:glycosyltransferase [Candidatus Acidoferrales bacterium]